MTAILERKKGRMEAKVKPRISSELKAFLPALTPEEFSTLEFLIVGTPEEPGEGIVEPLTIWKETGFLVDGFHRLDIAEKHNLPYKLHFQSFTDIESVKDWMASRQGGRRNLTPQQRTYFLGRQYRREVGTRGGEQTEGRKNVAEELAKDAGVSPGTVLNAAKYSEAVERIADFNPDARPQLLAGSVSDVTTLAKLPPKTIKVISDGLAKGQTVEEVKEKVPPAVLATVARKSGSPKFKDAKITKTIGWLARSLMDRAKEYGKSREYEACDKALEAFEAAWVRWTKATT